MLQSQCLDLLILTQLAHSSRASIENGTKTIKTLLSKSQIVPKVAQVQSKVTQQSSKTAQPYPITVQHLDLGEGKVIVRSSIIHKSRRLSINSYGVQGSIVF